MLYRYVCVCNGQKKFPHDCAYAIGGIFGWSTFSNDVIFGCMSPPLDCMSSSWDAALRDNTLLAVSDYFPPCKHERSKWWRGASLATCSSGTQSVDAKTATLKSASVQVCWWPP